MHAWLRELFDESGFMPHGHCYLWQPSLVWLHVSSDLLIGFAYVAISLTLYHLVRVIRLPFSAITCSFGVFIGACSLTHFAEVWTLWHPDYWLSGAIKVCTAVASTTTALWLIRLRPQIIGVAHAAETAERRRQQLETLNATLRDQAAQLARSNELLGEQHKWLIHSAKMTALGEMAGGLAHEINSPLAIIKLRAQQLRRTVRADGLRPEQVERDAEHIAGTVERIGSVVRGLQSFAGQGEREAYTEVPIAHLVRDALALCQERLKHRHIELQVAPLPASAVVCCRPAQICQVLLALLVNAHDAVALLAAKWIRIEAQDEGEAVRLTVTDSGLGIPTELAGRIMQPFFTTKAVGQGTGLGLSVSQGIVADHGGQLLLDATAAHTSFVLRLPKQRPRE